MLLFIAMHYWGYMSWEVKGWWEFSSLSLLITVVQQDNQMILCIHCVYSPLTTTENSTLGPKNFPDERRCRDKLRATVLPTLLSFIPCLCTRQLWVLRSIHDTMNYFTRLNKHPIVCIFGFWLRTVCVCACVCACMDSFVLSPKDQILCSFLASCTVSLETLCWELNY